MDDRGPERCSPIWSRWKQQAWLLVFASWAIPVEANFHLWRINELYSNADGTVQFIELFNQFDGEQFLSGNSIVSRNADGSAVRSFVFPRNLPTPSTGNRFLLLATPAFSTLPGAVAPDFTIPAGFLFPGGGMVQFVGADAVSHPALPTNGLHSINRFGVVDVNSPVNFAGHAGSVAPGNAPPQVQITSPRDGAAFSSPATITIAAFATDPDGTVARVEFLNGASSLGADSGAPFQATVTLTAGGYILTARATDNLGLTVESAPIFVSVLGSPSQPAVLITNPVAGATFSLPNPVPIEAFARDPNDRVTRVEFFANSTLIGTDTTAPFAISANLPAGDHALTARAVNSRGISTTSAVVPIRVGAINSPPSVAITQPADGSSFNSPTTVTVTAAASDTDGTVTQVEFFDNNTTLGVDPGAPFSVTTTLTVGEHVLTAVATDDLGGRTISAPVRVNVATAGGPPSVRLVTPLEGTSFVAPAQVTITAAASDPVGTIRRVEFFDGAQSLGLDTTSPFSLTLTLPAGNYTLSARATNDRGASTLSEPVRIVVVPEAGQRIENPIPARIGEGDVTIELQTVARDLISPIGMAVPGDRSNRIFIYDQAGLVHVLDRGTLLPTPLLDVRHRLVTLGIDGPGTFDERGLLGLAVHPQFASNPRIYTFTSEPVSARADFSVPIPVGRRFDHQSVIAEWRIDPANRNRVLPSSRRELLRIDQPQFNHNAGTLRFGPDGFLYASIGDGGGADDQDGQSFRGQPMVGHGTGNGQNPGNIYGTIIRIDVTGTDSANGQYGIPADNPFVGRPGLDEIFAFGFRNPFSFSFDLITGGLYVGDAGQNDVEEIDLVVRGGNYGWNVKEGSFFFNPNGDQPGHLSTQPVRFVPSDLIDPLAEYDHDDGTVVIGGFVYRGSQVPELRGRYVFGDFRDPARPSGRLFYISANLQPATLRIGVANRPLGKLLKGFGQDPSGEIYIFVSEEEGPFGRTGQMLKIVPAPSEIVITNAEVVGPNLRVQWAGGTGPFVVQRKNRLSEAAWSSVVSTTNRTAELPLTGNSGFFRVIQQ